MLTGKLSTLQNEVDELRGKLISAQSETLSRDLDLKQVCLEVLCRCEQLIRRHTSAFNKTVSYQQARGPVYVTKRLLPAEAGT